MKGKCHKHVIEWDKGLQCEILQVLRNMSSSGQHSEGKSWLQSKNKNIKTCFLEDLEEEMSGKRASFGGKGRLQSEQEVFNGKRNTATSTNEAIISRSHFSSSTPNIYSSSTPSTTKTGLKKSTKSNKLLGIKSALISVS